MWELCSGHVGLQEPKTMHFKRHDVVGFPTAYAEGPFPGAILMVVREIRVTDIRRDGLRCAWGLRHVRPSSL